MAGSMSERLGNGIINGEKMHIWRNEKSMLNNNANRFLDSNDLLPIISGKVKEAGLATRVSDLSAVSASQVKCLPTNIDPRTLVPLSNPSMTTQEDERQDLPFPYQASDTVATPAVKSMNKEDLTPWRGSLQVRTRQPSPPTGTARPDCPTTTPTPHQ